MDCPCASGEDVDVSDEFLLVLHCRSTEGLPRGLLGRVNVVDFSTLGATDGSCPRSSDENVRTWNTSARTPLDP